MPNIHRMYPDGTVSGGATWTPTGAATIHQAVDDLFDAADDNATYAQGSQAVWDYAYLSAAPMLDAIEITKVTAVCRYNNAGSGNTQEVDFGLRIGSTDYLHGAITVSSSSYITATKEWLVNPATGALFTKAQLDDIQIVIGTQDTIKPIDSVRVTMVHLEVEYQPIGEGLVPARGIITWRTRRCREEIPKVTITSKLHLADAELLDPMSITHYGLGAIEPDGDPSGIELWERHLFELREEEIDLNDDTVTHVLWDLRPLLCLIWYSGESRVSSSAIEDGVALLTSGGAREYLRDSRAYIEDPGSRLIVEKGINELPLAYQGVLLENFAGNILAHSSCKDGASSASALPGLSGSGTFTAQASPDDPYFDPAVSNHAYKQTKGNPHTTTQVQPVTTTASQLANTKLRLWFEYKDDPAGVSGDATRWRLVRNFNGNFWNDSTGAWQAGSVDNAAPLSTSRAEYLSKRIDVGANATTLTLSWVKNSGGTVGFSSLIYHWQLESNYWATSPVVTTAATYAREVQSLSFEHLPSQGKPALKVERGAIEIEAVPEWDGADMDAYGGFPTLFLLELDADNRFHCFYNSGTQTLDFVVEASAVEATASIPWTPVRGETYRIVCRWISASGEYGEDPYTIMVYLDGVRGTDDVRNGEPADADGLFYLGGDGGPNAFNGNIRRFVSLQYMLTEAEVIGFRP